MENLDSKNIVSKAPIEITKPDEIDNSKFSVGSLIDKMKLKFQNTLQGFGSSNIEYYQNNIQEFRNLLSDYSSYGIKRYLGLDFFSKVCGSKQNLEEFDLESLKLMTDKQLAVFLKNLQRCIQMGIPLSLDCGPWFFIEIDVLSDDDLERINQSVLSYFGKYNNFTTVCPLLTAFANFDCDIDWLEIVIKHKNQVSSGFIYMWLSMNLPTLIYGYSEYKSYPIDRVVKIISNIEQSKMFKDKISNYYFYYQNLSKKNIYEDYISDMVINENLDTDKIFDQLISVNYESFDSKDKLECLFKLLSRFEGLVDESYFFSSGYLNQEVISFMFDHFPEHFPFRYFNLSQLNTLLTENKELTNDPDFCKIAKSRPNLYFESNQYIELKKDPSLVELAIMDSSINLDSLVNHKDTFLFLLKHFDKSLLIDFKSLKFEFKNITLDKLGFVFGERSISEFFESVDSIYKFRTLQSVFEKIDSDLSVYSKFTFLRDIDIPLYDKIQIVSRFKNYIDDSNFSFIKKIIFKYKDDLLMHVYPNTCEVILGNLAEGSLDLDAVDYFLDNFSDVFLDLIDDNNLDKLTLITDLYRDIQNEVYLDDSNFKKYKFIFKKFLSHRITVSRLSTTQHKSMVNILKELIGSEIKLSDLLNDLDVFEKYKNSKVPEVAYLCRDFYSDSLVNQRDLDFCLQEFESIFLNSNTPSLLKRFKVFQVLFSPEEIPKKVFSPVLQNLDTSEVNKLILKDLLQVSLNSLSFEVLSFAQFYNYEQRLLLDKEFASSKEFFDFLEFIINLYKETFKISEDFEVNLDTYSYIKNQMNLDKDQLLVDKFISVYFKHLNINSYLELMTFVSEKKLNLKERFSMPERKLKLKSGQFLKSLPLQYFDSVLSNGFVSREYVGSGAASDATPLDVDLFKLNNDFDNISSALNAFDQSKYGEVSFVIDDKLVDGQGYETFHTGIHGETHYGIRTGVSIDCVSALILNFNYESHVDKFTKLKFLIAKKDLYLPIYNNEGDLIFSFDEFQKLRNLIYNDRDPIYFKGVLDFKSLCLEDLSLGNLYSYYQKEFDSQVVNEGYDLFTHTSMVLSQFQKYFSNLNEDFDSELVKYFKLFLILHDIGKPKSIDLKDKSQHEYTNEYLGDFYDKFNIPQRIQLIFNALIQKDLMGSLFKKLNNFSTLNLDYLKMAYKDVLESDFENSNNESNQNKLGSEYDFYFSFFKDFLTLAKASGLSNLEFLNLFKVYYMCDASSYTSDAGAKKSLEFLFDDLDTSNKLKLNPKLNGLLESIAELIKA